MFKYDASVDWFWGIFYIGNAANHLHHHHHPFFIIFFSHLLLILYHFLFLPLPSPLPHVARDTSLVYVKLQKSWATAVMNSFRLCKCPYLHQNTFPFYSLATLHSHPFIPLLHRYLYHHLSCLYHNSSSPHCCILTSRWFRPKHYWLCIICAGTVIFYLS